MSWCGLDAWEAPLFANVVPKVDIPCQDHVAWQHYPRRNHVYDKLWLTRQQDVSCGPAGTIPPNYPVIEKPIINLYGMAHGVRLLEEEDEYRPGYFWMPVIPGPNYSADIVLEQGRIRWWSVAVGTETDTGVYSKWTLVDEPLPSFVIAMTEKLGAHTGVINLEWRSEVVMEFHLRMSCQWVDLYPAGWLEAIAKLYEQGIWIFDGGAGEGESHVYFGEPDWTGAISVQYPNDLDASPPGRFITAIVNKRRLTDQ